MTARPRRADGLQDTVSRAVVGLPGARRLIVRLARHRTLVLLYHRVVASAGAAGAPRPTVPRGPSIVPSVPVDLLRAHLEALRGIGPIVPLEEAGDGTGPRFALTFDDDAVEHAEQVLPLLEELGVPATFFLSGRWLHGRGAYWWQVLEERLADHGLAGTGAQLAGRCDGDDPALAGRIRTASTPAALAAVIAGTPATGWLEREGAGPGRPACMDGDDLRRLVDAGMRIGFHTVDHPVLTSLDDDALADALMAGRAQLEAAVGGSITSLAYPYGRARRREADAAAVAGFATAYTTAHRPVSARTDPRLRGRWEPGARAPEAVAVGALQRLARAPVGSERDW